MARVFWSASVHKRTESRMSDNARLNQAHPSPDAFAYRVKEVRLMGGPCRTKVYELAKKGDLKLIRIDGRTVVEGDSLRRLLRHGNSNQF